MTRAFYDLRPDVPYEPGEIAMLQHEGQIDRERQSVERAWRRQEILGTDDRALRRALARLHAREERPDR
jgi:hypothetical protein